MGDKKQKINKYLYNFSESCKCYAEENNTRYAGLRILGESDLVIFNRVAIKHLPDGLIFEQSLEKCERKIHSSLGAQ